MLSCTELYPRVSTDTTIRESGPIPPSVVWFLGPNSIIVISLYPLGISLTTTTLR